MTESNASSAVQFFGEGEHDAMVNPELDSAANFFGNLDSSRSDKEMTLSRPQFEVEDPGSRSAVVSTTDLTDTNTRGSKRRLGRNFAEEEHNESMRAAHQQTTPSSSPTAKKTASAAANPYGHAYVPPPTQQQQQKMQQQQQQPSSAAASSAPAAVDVRRRRGEDPSSAVFTAASSSSASGMDRSSDVMFQRSSIAGKPPLATSAAPASSSNNSNSNGRTQSSTGGGGQQQTTTTSSFGAAAAAAAASSGNYQQQQQQPLSAAAGGGGANLISSAAQSRDSERRGSRIRRHQAFGSSTSTEDEINSIWQCCAHPSSCYESLMCCPCQIQRQLAAIEAEQPHVSENGPSLLYAATWFLVLPALRFEVNTRMGREAGCVSDFAAGACCPFLSLAQTYRQLAYLGRAPGGWFVEPYPAGAAAMH